MGSSRSRMTLLVETARLWSAHNAFQHAAALAFYTLFSMAPLLIILIAVTSVVLGEEAVRGEISAQLDSLIGRQAAETVEDAVRRSRVAEAGLFPTIAGIGALLLGSTTVFAQMQSSLNQMWGVTAKPSRNDVAVFLTNRLLSLSLVLIVGFLLLVSFVVTATVAAVLQFANSWVPVPGAVVTVLDIGTSLVISTLLFGVIFKVLPDVRLAWSDMWRGAAVTALLFVGGQSLISMYLTHAATASTYGAAGSLVLVLMWVYYSSLILFFGAAMTRARVGLRGERLVPKPSAVRIRLDLIEPDAPAGDPAVPSRA